MHYIIIIGRGGNPSIHIDSKFGISHDVCYVLRNNDDVITTYIYKYLKTNMDIIKRIFRFDNKTYIKRLFIKNKNSNTPVKNSTKKK